MYKAEVFSHGALKIREGNLGFDRPDVADILHQLGVYASWKIERLEEAELFFRRALKIREDLLGPDHLGVADTLHSSLILSMCSGWDCPRRRCRSDYGRALGFFDGHW